MKRKFFSLMVAACAALFSFTGLTGCGGGGESDSVTEGYLTYSNFTESLYGLRIYGAPVYIEIRPVEKDTSISGSPGPYDSRVMIGFISDRGGRDKMDDVILRYNITDWIVPQKDATPLQFTTDELRALPEAVRSEYYQKALPRCATMTVSLARAANTSNSTLLANLGLYQNDVRIKSAIEYHLTFTGYGGTVTMAVRGDDGDSNATVDSVEQDNIVNQTTTFDVLKSL